MAWMDAAVIARLDASCIEAWQFPVGLISNLGEREALALIFLTLLVCWGWSRLAVTALGAAAAASIASSVIKAVVGRARPDGASSSHAFPSGHAAVMFAVAFVLAKRFPRFRYAFYCGAFTVALSRVLLLKHYPSDVLAGAALGLLVAAGVVALLAHKLPNLDALRWPRYLGAALLIPLAIHMATHSGKLQYVSWIVVGVAIPALAWTWLVSRRTRQGPRPAAEGGAGEGA